MEIDLSKDALTVAPELLNYRLCRRINGEIIKLRITEVEAYHGFEDKASHAHKGMTPRNAVMFGEQGHWYVYLCYGVHWLLNLVTANEGYPSAVLIRGIEGYNGPGKLTKAMQINKELDREKCTKDAGLWIEPLPENEQVDSNKIITAPRIGVAYAGEIWANKPWRFLIKSS